MSQLRSFYVCLLVSCTVIAPCLCLAESELEYAFILKGRGNPYWQAAVQGIEETATDLRISHKVFQISSDIAAEEQLNLCLSVIAMKPKMIAISAVTPAVGLQCMKQAMRANVRVADLDSNVTPAEAASAGVPLAFSVGSDNYLVGKSAADYLASVTKTPNPKILVLEGAVGSVPGQGRVRGFVDRLRELLPQAQQVASVSAEWDRLKGMNVTNDILQREPELEFVYAANDMMALGAVEAVRVAGLMGKVQVIGVDGTPDARKAIEEGKLLASVAQLPYLIGKRSVEKSVQVIKGETTEVIEKTPTPVLHRQLLAANTDPLLRYVR
ncbi:MAG: substrate-binding domain-containing protein [Bdellovibrionota bacterium]|nr:MAG: substrate-binding domain-containing protein [Bdellovibrionota bacterium]